MAGSEQSNTALQDPRQADTVPVEVKVGVCYSKSFRFPTLPDSADFIRKLWINTVRAWCDNIVMVQVDGERVAAVDMMATECHGVPDEGKHSQWSDKRWI